MAHRYIHWLCYADLCKTGVDPSIDTLSIMMDGFTFNEEWDTAMAVLEEVKHDNKLSAYYNQLYLRATVGAAKHSQWHIVGKFIDTAWTSGKVLQFQELNVILQQAVQQKKSKMAFHIASMMQENCYEIRNEWQVYRYVHEKSIELFNDTDGDILL